MRRGPTLRLGLVLTICAFGCFVYGCNVELTNAGFQCESDADCGGVYQCLPEPGGSGQLICQPPAGDAVMTSPDGSTDGSSDGLDQDAVDCDASPNDCPLCDPGFTFCDGRCLLNPDPGLCTAECSGGEILCNGQCTAISSFNDDVDNCGACMIGCGAANGTPTCSNGSCEIDSCLPNFGDCNTDPGDGCEAALDTVENCGSCGVTCGTDEFCVNGLCEASCDMDVCGPDCVDTMSDPVNCGSCDTVCDNTNGTASCMAGTCAIACDGGADDCNLDLTDGCETVLGTDTNCATCGDDCSVLAGGTGACDNGVCECESGLTLCNGVCLDLDSDPNHCGQCGQVCDPGTAVCNDGSCDARCDFGLIECNGGCFEHLDNEDNCGTCGNVCASNEVCNGLGECALSCANGFTLCDDECVDLMANGDHCGACNSICGGTEACDGGSCAPACDGVLSACDNLCVNPLTNPDHCGVCSRECAVGEVCLSGSCQPECPVGYYNCDGACVDGSQRYACGASCDVCGDGQVCNGLGQCTQNCAAGFTRCGDTCVELAWDLLHCGTCDNTCTGGRACREGSCVFGCNPASSGRFLCLDGCVDRDVDTRHCGSCGNVCTNGTQCQSGACL